MRTPTAATVGVFHGWRMTAPLPDDRPNVPGPTAPPLPLEYERPNSSRRRPCSRVAIAALVVGILSVLVAVLQARATIGVRLPVGVRWTELVVLLLPLFGVGLSINALFRI